MHSSGIKMPEDVFLPLQIRHRREFMNFRIVAKITVTLIFTLAMAGSAFSQENSDPLRKTEPVKTWKTKIENRSVELSEIISGGPPKDGIPALNAPKIVSIKNAEKWLKPNEPVISLKIGRFARAYPLQILIWHEIVNDEIGGQPVAVTFCPLCYTAIALDRKLDGKIYNFGVSGMLRHSDMIMFDRETESWWQQFSGEAIVGDLTGKTLNQFPSQIVSFEQFSNAFPNGKVLSRETGYDREYGKNPYLGYDDINKRPFLFRGNTDKRLRPMEKIIAIEIDSKPKAYPYSITREKYVLTDRIGSTDIVIFHSDGASSALDKSPISESKNVGSTGVFVPEVDGGKLTFTYAKGEFIDEQTKTRWNIFGQATEGKLKGRTLKQIKHGDYFAFAWLVFKPQTLIYTEKQIFR